MARRRQSISASHDSHFGNRPKPLPQHLQLRLGTVLDGISQAKQIKLGEDSINGSSWPQPSIHAIG